MEVPLLKKLKKGRVYYAGLWVRVSQYQKYTSNNIGMYFSTKLIQGIDTYHTLDFKPQINFIELVKDISRWIYLEGKFKAKTKAKYLIIGNFFSDDKTKSEEIDSPIIKNESNGVFFYVDDVYVGRKPRFKRSVLQMR